MKAVIALGNPELHTALSRSRIEGFAMPDLWCTAKIGAEEISLFCFESTGRLGIKAAFIGLARWNILIEESMIGCYEHMAPVQVVNDEVHQRRQFVNGPSNCSECLRFGGGGVSNCIDLIVVDIDYPPGLYELPSLILAHLTQFFGFDRYTLEFCKNLGTIFHRSGGLPIDQQICVCVQLVNN